MGKIRRWLKQLKRSNLQPSLTYQSGSVLRSVTPHVGPPDQKPEDEPTRKEVRPVDVVNELTSNVPEVDMVDLTRKIKAVEARLKALKRAKVGNISNETIALGYLHARNKYPKYSKLFTWPTTNQQIIDGLCSKYAVETVGLGGYVRNLPAEGVAELEKFMDAWERVRDDDPEFWLVIDSGGLEKKKDPILLAPSPFGNWMYVLGAWDKEVQYVDEIIYHGK